MRLRHLVAPLAVIAGLVSAGPAFGATVSGSVTDAEGDATQSLDPLTPDDVSSVGVKFAETASSGTITVNVAFHDWNAASEGDDNYSGYVGLGRMQDGYCNTEVYSSVRNNPYRIEANLASVSGTITSEDVTINDDGATYVLTHAAFARRTYDCVESYFSASRPSANLYTSDEVGRFCMSESGTVACPTSPPPPPPDEAPPAPTGMKALLTESGVRLSWDASTEPDFSYFAVRRGNQADTNKGTWVRLHGDFKEPTTFDKPGPGTHYYYVTQIDTSGKVSKRSNVVKITVPSPPTDEPKPPVVVPPPVVVSPPVVSRPVVAPPPPPVVVPPRIDPPSPMVVVIERPKDQPIVTPPQTTQTTPRLSLGRAKRTTRMALADVYGREYRTRRAFKLKCRRTASHKATCRTSWATKRYRYHGNVLVTRAVEEVVYNNRVKRSRRR